jgi:hypothetical protein
MANVSTVLPANIIPTSRTAAPNAASSTATPYDSGNIVTWTLPGFPTQKLVSGTQSFSTTQGQVFTDFASGVLVPMPAQLPTGPATYSTQAGSPEME